MKQNKTTQKHFKEFEKECLYWMDFLGMGGWEKHFVHMAEDVEKFLSACAPMSEDRIASFILNKNWGDEKTTLFNLRRKAFHEVAELMLSPLEILVKKRDVDQARTETHKIVRILEDKLFDSTYEQRFGKGTLGKI
ncbi:MAG: hypothetical protein GY853_13245 [PVC group bacterium]|nr:hypothetical protein [PVC group bacterium]